MMSPTPLPGSSTGGPAYDDTALSQRVSGVEGLTSYETFPGSGIRAPLPSADLKDGLEALGAAVNGGSTSARIEYAFDPFAIGDGGTLTFDLKLSTVPEDPVFPFSIFIDPNETPASLAAKLAAAEDALVDEIDIVNPPGTNSIVFSSPEVGENSVIVISNVMYDGGPETFGFRPMASAGEMTPSVWQALAALTITADAAEAIAVDAFNRAYNADTKAQQALDAGGVVYKRQFLGIHAVTSGTTFNKAALLARSFLAGVPTNEVEVDLYLVGGGGSGGGFANSFSDSGSANTRGGGCAGDVRIRPRIALHDLAHGTTLQVGAGGVGTNSGQNIGGNTVFGSWIARGGLTGIVQYGLTSSLESSVDLSDLPTGRPGLQSSTLINALPSNGPGAGGSGKNGFDAPSFGYGGRGGSDDNALTTNPGIANGSAGESGPAESLRYGAGGAGASYGTNVSGGAGGFPGGGGGGCVSTNTVPKNGGNGGNGVIRFACYRMVSA